MSATRDPQTIITTWLDEGPLDLPEDTRRAITVGVRTTTQRRVRFPWLDVPRPTTGDNMLRIGLALAGIALAAVIGFAVWGGDMTGLVAQSPSPAPTPSPTPSLAGPAPAGTPRSGGIAYVTGGADQHIAMVDPMTGETRALTPSLVELARDEGCRGLETMVYASGLAWSPDGRALVFQLHAGTVGGSDVICGLYVVSSDGARVTQLLPPPDAERRGGYGGAWTPDGTMLAVTLWNSVGLLPLDGSAVQDLGGPAECPLGEKCILGIPNPDHQPTLLWSPDGEWLAVWLVRLDDGEPMQLTAVVDRFGNWQIVAGDRDSRPVGWMPDGRLAVSTDSGLVAFGFSATDPAGPGEEIPLPFSVIGKISPDWTRDVLAVGVGPRIRDLSSGEITEIANWSGPATWSPDGTQLAVMRNDSEVWVIGADGSDARRLASGLRFWSTPQTSAIAWQPVWPSVDGGE